MSNTENEVLFEDKFSKDSLRYLIDGISIFALCIIISTYSLIWNKTSDSILEWIVLSLSLIAFVATTIIYIRRKKYKLSVTENQVIVCYGKQKHIYKFDDFVGYTYSKAKKSDIWKFDMFYNKKYKGYILVIHTVHCDEMIDLLMKHGKQKMSAQEAKEL